MELTIIAKELPKISFNKEEIKKEVEKNLKKYKGLVFVDESELTEAKTIRASLNKVAKTFDDERKRIKKELSSPIIEFENDIKEITGMINQVNYDIDLQVKAFEEKKRQDKLEKVKELWGSLSKPNIKIEQVFDETWLNASKKIEKVQEEMQERIAEIDNSLETIKQFTENKIHQAEIEYEYLRTLNLPEAIKNFKERQQAIQETITKKVAIEETQQESTDETPKKAEQKVFILTFEIKGTESQMQIVSDFLKANNIEYRRVK